MKVTIKFPALDAESVRVLEELTAGINVSINTYGDSTILSSSCSMQQAVTVIRSAYCFEIYEIKLSQDLP